MRVMGVKGLESHPWNAADLLKDMLSKTSFHTNHAFPATVVQSTTAATPIGIHTRMSIPYVSLLYTVLDNR